MKTILRFILGVISIYFIQACSSETESNKHNTGNAIDLGCTDSFEIAASGNDTINKTYGVEKIKHGHWITYQWGNNGNNKNQVNRIIMEEGFYIRNKKVGFWKFYNKDGTLKDSIEYKSDVPLPK